jgi:hypothetical protein
MNYTYEQKKKIAYKIGKLKKKEHFIDIFGIIWEDTISLKKEIIEPTENKNGIFLYFHKLSDHTYKKIEYYLKKNSENNNNTNCSINTIDDYSHCK